MSEPLSGSRFEQFVEAYTQNHATLVTTLGDHTKRLDTIDDRLNRLEQLLQVQQRVDRIEVLLAEQFGRDVLARAGL